MRTPDRARQGALVPIAVAAATAALGIAALANAGAALCGHRLLVHHHDPAMAMAGGTAMAAVPADGICSILLYAAAVATSLCLAAVLVLAARPVASALAAAFQLLVPSAGAPWALVRDPLLVPAGVRLARRRPSRGPPALR